MDTATLLAGSLALSAVALPLIMGLFVKNIKLEMRAEWRLDADKLKKDIETDIETKFNKIVENLNHKKVSLENIDAISKRLFKVLEKFDKKPHDLSYDD